jgi:hypothetical protein
MSLHMKTHYFQMLAVLHKSIHCMPPACHQNLPSHHITIAVQHSS